MILKNSFTGLCSFLNKCIDIKSVEYLLSVDRVRTFKISYKATS